MFRAKVVLVCWCRLLTILILNTTRVLKTKSLRVGVTALFPYILHPQYWSVGAGRRVGFSNVDSFHHIVLPSLL